MNKTNIFAALKAFAITLSYLLLMFFFSEVGRNLPYSTHT